VQHSKRELILSQILTQDGWAIGKNA